MSSTVGPTELAEALGVSERHVYRLHEIGMPKDGRGEYPLVRCCRWYRVHVLSGPGDDDAPDLGEARLRKARARALEAERELARRREQLIPAEVWDDVTAEADAWLRDRLETFAREWAAALEGVETPQEAAEILRQGAREGLEELRQGPPRWDDMDTDREAA